MSFLMNSMQNSNSPLEALIIGETHHYPDAWIMLEAFLPTLKKKGYNAVCLEGSSEQKDLKGAEINKVIDIESDKLERFKIFPNDEIPEESKRDSKQVEYIAKKIKEGISVDDLNEFIKFSRGREKHTAAMLSCLKKVKALDMSVVFVDHPEANRIAFLKRLQPRNDFMIKSIMTALEKYKNVVVVLGVCHIVDPWLENAYSRGVVRLLHEQKKPNMALKNIYYFYTNESDALVQDSLEHIRASGDEVMRLINFTKTLINPDDKALEELFTMKPPEDKSLNMVRVKYAIPYEDMHFDGLIQYLKDLGGSNFSYQKSPNLIFVDLPSGVLIKERRKFLDMDRKFILKTALRADQLDFLKANIFYLVVEDVTYKGKQGYFLTFPLQHGAVALISTAIDSNTSAKDAAAVNTTATAVTASHSDAAAANGSPIHVGTGASAATSVSIGNVTTPVSHSATTSSSAQGDAVKPAPTAVPATLAPS